MFSVFLRTVCNAPHDWQVTFQTPATDIMSKIVDLHHDVMFFLVFILLFVSYFMLVLINGFGWKNGVTRRLSFQHHELLEQIWTLIPALILITIAVPSFSLLYSMDEMPQPLMTIRVIGHQWYWGYETTTPEGLISFEQYMLPEIDINQPSLRLLSVDFPLRLPIRQPLRLLMTSRDVIHSWAIPAFGVKMDACPGRLNQVSLNISRAGTYYGQCSELCGINHSFMPIEVIAE